MEILLGARTADETEVEGFYHCHDCLAKIWVDFGFANRKVLGFKTRLGEEVLAVSYSSSFASLVSVMRLCVLSILGISANRCQQYDDIC